MTRAQMPRRTLPFLMTDGHREIVAALKALVAERLGERCAGHLVGNALGAMVEQEDGDTTCDESLLDALRRNLEMNRERARGPNPEPALYAPFLSPDCDAMIEQVASAWETGCECCAARAVWCVDLTPEERPLLFCDAHLPSHFDLAAERV